MTFAALFDPESDDPRYVGRPADEVVAEVERAGLSVRRWNADVDDQAAAWTLDFIVGGRLNLWVERDVVVHASWF